jgi:hypothetical protein
MIKFYLPLFSPLDIIIPHLWEKSSGNLHKRFASKIVGVVQIAEIPASASDKGRPICAK